VSGATGEDFDKLRAKAREMGAKTKFSASEAADAMNYMAMAGWKTSDMLDGIEGIMNLAAASSNANTNVFRTLAAYQEPCWYRIYADDGISGTNTKNVRALTV
jgi:TP901 family phage tail tape measure protein